MVCVGVRCEVCSVRCVGVRCVGVVCVGVRCEVCSVVKRHGTQRGQCMNAHMMHTPSRCRYLFLSLEGLFHLAS